MKKSMTVAVLEGLRFRLEKQIKKSRDALTEVEALEDALEILVDIDE